MQETPYLALIALLVAITTPLWILGLLATICSLLDWLVPLQPVADVMSSKPASDATEKRRFAEVAYAAECEFKPEEAYEAAQRLFPDLDELSTRQLGFEILFTTVKNGIGLTEKQNSQYLSAVSLAKQRHDQQDFDARKHHARQSVAQADRDLATAMSVLTEAKLAQATGLQYNMETAHGAVKTAETALARVHFDLDQLNAEEARSLATVTELKSLHQLASLFNEWREKVLSRVRTTRQRLEIEMEEDRLDALAGYNWYP